MIPILIALAAAGWLAAAGAALVARHWRTRHRLAWGIADDIEIQRVEAVDLLRQIAEAVTDNEIPVMPIYLCVELGVDGPGLRTEECGCRAQLVETDAGTGWEVYEPCPGCEAYPVPRSDLVECWSCTVDRVEGDSPCWYCDAPTERPARGPVVALPAEVEQIVAEAVAAGDTVGVIDGADLVR